MKLQLVSAMRLVSGECLKFVQVALLGKLDVIYSISNDVSVLSAENRRHVPKKQIQGFLIIGWKD